MYISGYQDFNKFNNYYGENMNYFLSEKRLNQIKDSIV